MEDASQPLETTLVGPQAWAETQASWPIAPAAPATPALGVGAIVGKALSAWWRNLLPFTILSVVAYLPLAAAFTMLWNEVRRDQGGPAVGPVLPDEVLGFLFFGAMLAAAALYVVVHGGVVFGTFGHLRGERAGIGRMLVEGLRRSPSVAVVMIVAGLGTLAGLFLLLAPGVMLASAWAASVPACVVERVGPFAGAARSAALTRGQRTPVFLAVLALLGLAWAASLAIQTVVAVIVVAAVGPERSAVAIVMLPQLGGILFGMLPAIGTATAYHELRAAREGLDAGRLAAVFE